MTIATALQC